MFFKELEKLNYVIYYTIGEFDTAREYWGRLISINPELMEAKRAQDLLDNL